MRRWMGGARRRDQAERQDENTRRRQYFAVMRGGAHMHHTADAIPPPVEPARLRVSATATENRTNVTESRFLRQLDNKNEKQKEIGLSNERRKKMKKSTRLEAYDPDNARRVDHGQGNANDDGREHKRVKVFQQGDIDMNNKNGEIMDLNLTNHHHQELRRKRKRKRGTDHINENRFAQYFDEEQHHHSALVDQQPSTSCTQGQQKRQQMMKNTTNIHQSLRSPNNDLERGRAERNRFTIAATSPEVERKNNTNLLEHRIHRRMLPHQETWNARENNFATDTRTDLLMNPDEYFQRRRAKTAFVHIMHTAEMGGGDQSSDIRRRRGSIPHARDVDNVTRVETNAVVRMNKQQQQQRIQQRTAGNVLVDDTSLAVTGEREIYDRTEGIRRRQADRDNISDEPRINWINVDQQEHRERPRQNRGNELNDDTSVREENDLVEFRRLIQDQVNEGDRNRWKTRLIGDHRRPEDRRQLEQPHEEMSEEMEGRKIGDITDEIRQVNNNEHEGHVHTMNLERNAHNTNLEWKLKIINAPHELVETKQKSRGDRKVERHGTAAQEPRRQKAHVLGRNAEDTTEWSFLVENRNNNAGSNHVRSMNATPEMEKEADDEMEEKDKMCFNFLNCDDDDDDDDDDQQPEIGSPMHKRRRRQEREQRHESINQHMIECDSHGLMQHDRINRLSGKVTTTENKIQKNIEGKESAFASMSRSASHGEQGVLMTTGCDMDWMKLEGEGDMMNASLDELEHCLFVRPDKDGGQFARRPLGRKKTEEDDRKQCVYSEDSGEKEMRQQVGEVDRTDGNRNVGIHNDMNLNVLDGVDVKVSRCSNPIAPTGFD